MVKIFEKTLITALLIVTVISAFNISVFAANTPKVVVESISVEELKQIPKYTVSIDDDENGTVNHKTIMKDEGQIEVITAHPSKGYTFDMWVVEGDYYIYKGEKTDETIKIVVNSDCTVTPYYKVQTNNKTTNSSLGTTKTDTSNKTFVFIVFILIPCLVLLFVINREVKRCIYGRRRKYRIRHKTKKAV